MTTTTRPVPWWHTAPNPPCAAAWCTRNHRDDEFSGGGTLLCTRIIADSHVYSVEVQQCTGLDQSEDGIEVDPPSVWLNVIPEELTEAQAHELGLALVRAGDVIRRGAAR